jgi:hypothetical protein
MLAIGLVRHCELALYDQLDLLSSRIAPKQCPRKQTQLARSSREHVHPFGFASLLA